MPDTSTDKPSGLVNVEWYRRMNAATRLCTTGDNTMAFRTAGVRIDRTMSEFEAASLALQPLDAPEFLPVGATSGKGCEGFVVRPGFDPHPRIAERGWK